jgi:hypothetical protein
MTRRGASASDIVALAAELAGAPRGRIDRDDLLASPGLDGRAVSRFLQSYAGRFGVDMRGYRWWFHHRDHGALAMPLVALDGERREIRIPLSAEMLAGFAERGRWDIAYPPHRLGLRSRWWAVVVFGIVALGLIYAIAR